MAASYPGAVKTFTTKSDGAGNKIQADHVNAMQDEITAIEDGILNGSAPITSSNIIAPSASLTNSTITNATITNAQITNCTVASLSFAASPDAIRVRMTARVNLAQDTWTPLSWNDQVWQTGSTLHSTATNPSRLKAPSSGLYACHASVWFGSTAANGRWAQILKNSTTVLASMRFEANETNQDPIILSVSAVELMASTTDYVEVRVLNDASTGHLDSTAAAYAVTATWMKIR